jgi:hypothetical protein
MTCRLKDGIVEQVEATADMQRHAKHVSMATDSNASIEDEVFSICSLSRIYNKEQ